MLWMSWLNLQIWIFSHYFSTLSTNKSVFLEIAMVQVLGSMEDEHFFKFLAFCKSKLHIRISNNLGLMIRMFF